MWQSKYQPQLIMKEEEKIEEKWKIIEEAENNENENDEVNSNSIEIEETSINGMKNNQ